MKNFKLFAAAILALTFTSLQAQPPKGSNWQEKVRSEKVAFITSELELTSDEAQVFWPVYNQIAADKTAAQKASRDAYNALKKAIEEGTASDKEINDLLNAYLASKDLCQKVCQDNADRYRKVLPDKKVAKLYIAEEKFRRQHIRSMKGGKPGAGRPGGQNGAGRAGGNGGFGPRNGNPGGGSGAGRW